MHRKYRVAIYLTLSVVALALLVWFLCGDTMAVLSPKGLIGMKQKHLILISTLLMLIVVIPVFILTIGIAWRYREGNKQAKYNPDWDYSLLAESIWWGLPLIIIIVLSVLVWKSSHELDPFRPIDSDKKPITIQVVAMNWKWLFIYPEQEIAMVNFFQVPEKTPIQFEITSDAPMNSFWIPELGGQIFAMSGMVTKLYLMADEIGEYRGVSANISGKGFAGMTFIAKASSEAEFEQWVESVKDSSPPLGAQEYKLLAEPSEYNPVATYRLTDGDLFNGIVMKYMMPSRGTYKIPQPGKIALSSHFIAPPSSPTLSSMYSAAGYRSRGGPDKLTQNLRFFRVGEFCKCLSTGTE